MLVLVNVTFLDIHHLLSHSHMFKTGNMESISLQEYKLLRVLKYDINVILRNNSIMLTFSFNIILIMFYQFISHFNFQLTHKI